MNIALVLSGGIGSRLMSQVPKQYVMVQGRMIVIHTLMKLCRHKKIDAVHVVCENAWREPILTELHDATKLRGFSAPGANRQLSILNGLRDMSDYADDEDVVFIHDAVRPCISNKMIGDTIDAIARHDGVVPVLPLKDTVYSSEDGKHLTGLLERARILAGQSPEAFLYGRYLSANESLSMEEIMRISGSAEPALLAGMDIVTIPGDENNFKITTNHDMDRFIEIVTNEESYS